MYENEPLFRFERGARRSLRVRKAYAIHYASLTSEDGRTGSDLLDQEMVSIWNILTS